MLYFGAHTIYNFYEAPPQMISLGVPYLRIRAIGVFFAFIYFALIGFLRGIKNPKLPMLFFILTNGSADFYTSIHHYNA